mmetsp:Transcript_18737/g.26567  ORF Transcript_18737/g.26567 Transcript_18737/m.26567 type:complete len:191 (-) Transcript_18737:292-864(-)
MMSTTSEITVLNKLGYFVAGALLPTLAYVGYNLSKKATVANDDDSNEGASSDDELQEQLGKPSSDPRGWGMRDCPYKMVLCVNKELKMGKGKIAAQCCHAAVGCYKRARKHCPAAVSAWELSGCAKVAVQCETQEEMEEILVRAYNLGIPCYLVEDAGRTQIAAGSRTVLGLGPAPVRVYEGLTSHLKLM